MRLAATEEIRKQLAAEGLDYLANDGFLEVDQDAYDHFAAMVHDGYKHLSDAEREALIVVCCFTHPNHRPQPEKPEPPAAPSSTVVAWKEPGCVGKREFRWWMAAIIFLLLMLFAAKAKAQNGTSQIDVIKFTDSADANIKSFAGPFTFKCGATLTCTVSGSKLTMTVTTDTTNASNISSGTLGFARLPAFQADKQDPGGSITGDSTDKTVYTYSMPANTLGSGKCLRITWGYQHTTGTTSTTFKLIFGATTLISNASTTAVPNVMTALVCNNASSTTAQWGLAYGQVANAAIVASSTSPAENTASGSIVIKATFNVANTDAVTGKGWSVELLP